MDLRRGDLVTVALSGDYGKPRPALIVQADAFIAIPSVTIAGFTSALRDVDLFRVRVQPSQMNGLRELSDVMLDKLVTVPRNKLGHRVGQLEAETMTVVDQALRAFLGLT